MLYNRFLLIYFIKVTVFLNLRKVFRLCIVKLYLFTCYT